MLVRPMIGRWEVPHVEAIATRESRRLARLPVPGLSGDLHQDLGRDALEVELHGSLSGDQARDEFLKELRTQFLVGDPVDFVADIVNESELEQVLITAFELQESADRPDEFRYRLGLREHTEPPEPPGLADDFGLGVDGLLDLDVDLGLDLLDLAGLLGSVPEIGDLLSPVEEAAARLKDTLASAGTLLTPIEDLY